MAATRPARRCRIGLPIRSGRAERIREAKAELEAEAKAAAEAKLKAAAEAQGRRDAEGRNIDAYVATGRARDAVAGSVTGEATAAQLSPEPAGEPTRVEGMRAKIKAGGPASPYRLRKQLPEPVFGQIKQSAPGASPRERRRVGVCRPTFRSSVRSPRAPEAFSE
jgi:hypothetical protein